MISAWWLALTNQAKHNSWHKLGVEQPFLVLLVRVEGITHSWMQKWLRCFHIFIFSKVSSEGIASVTYLSFLFNMRTELFFLYISSVSPKQGSVSSRLQQSQGRWSYLRLPKIIIHITVMLLCCWWSFFLSFCFILFVFYGGKKKGSRVFLALRHVTQNKRPQFLALFPSNSTSWSTIFHRMNCWYSYLHKLRAATESSSL